MKYTTLALFLFIISILNLNAQADNSYETFDFIYIDNSRPSSSDELSKEQISMIKKQVSMIAGKNGKLILFASNGESPKVTTSTGQINAFLDDLLRSDTSFPRNKFLEKKRIRKVFYDDEFKVGRQVNLHFFVTDKYAAELEKEPGLLASMLPIEFAATLAYNKLVTTTLYVNDKQSKKLKFEKINKNLEYQTKQLKLQTKYKVINL